MNNIKTDSKEIRTLRAMAWRRAKGELYAMLDTFWVDDNFTKLSLLVDNFIEEVEDNEYWI